MPRRTFVLLKRYLLAPYSFALLCILLPLGSCGGNNLSNDSSNSISHPSLQPATNVVSSVALHLPHCPSAPNPLQKISTVHGSVRSPAHTEKVVTLRGVVTANFQASGQLHGIFMQQATTVIGSRSDGLFVYLPLRFKPLDAGSFIQVSGTIQRAKNRDGRDDGQLRLAAVSEVTVCGDGPAIAPRNLTLPVDDLRRLEALDGMLVRLPQRLTVSDNHELGYRGELVVSANDRQWQPYNHPSLSDPDDVIDLNQRSRLVLGDGSTATRPIPTPYLSAADDSGTRRVGDTVSDVEGILTQSFGVWRLQPTQRPIFTDTNPRPPLPQSVGGTVRIASINVLSYFTTLNQRGAKSAEDLKRQRDKLITAIKGLDADVLGLMEIENTSEALRDLVDALNADTADSATSSSPRYVAIESPVVGTDAIKVAIIYKPARLQPVGAAESPRSSRSDGGIGVSRPPVAQRFTLRDSGNGFWMVVNHLKSKSRCPTDAGSADQDQGQGCWNATRVRQAAATARWVNALGARYAQSNTVLMGDFNAYIDEDPIRTLVGNGFEDLLQRMPAAERYSYSFDGRAGALDHAFVDAALRDKVSGATIWHINADEPAVFDYQTNGKSDDRYTTSPFRASDHDPLLLGLAL